MKKLVFKITLLSFLILGAPSCKKLVEGINVNPNEPVAITSKEQLIAPMLAQITVQVGHLARISNMWTGYFRGIDALYQQLYLYQISTAETESTWENAYQGVVAQCRDIRKRSPDDKLLQGICKVLEAHAMGTLAALFGNIPYAEAINAAGTDPKFDNQAVVYTNIQTLLDGAITDLGGATGYYSQDLFFGTLKLESVDKWKAVAYTLKARYYLEVKDYPKAYTAAGNGVSSHSNSMYFKPPADAVIGKNSNTLHSFEGARGGDMTSVDSFFETLLSSDTTESRNHSKTNETARKNYYTIDKNTSGMARIDAWMPLVTYEENLLILAESAVRGTQGFSVALGHLNTHRAYLRSSDVIFKSDGNTDASQYDDFVESDFQTGGIEFTTGLSKEKALLKEIIEERYASFCGQILAFNDMRRLRKSDKDTAIYYTAPIPYNVATVTGFPERFPYPTSEIDSNSNLSSDPGINQITEVNQ